MLPIEKKVKDFATLIDDMTQGMGLRDCLKKLNMSPCVFYHLLDDPVRKEQYARAKQIQGEILANEIIQISDDKTVDPNHKRIMVDSRKWYASKVLPKLYGEHQQIDLSVRDYTLFEESVKEKADGFINKRAKKVNKD